MIAAKVIADSVSPTNKRITTFELEYPRFIHSEFMTHRMFSRNAASSRAIPVARSIDLIRENTAMPIHWGRNRPGMSAREECTELFEDGSKTREEMWNIARDNAIEIASKFADRGYHKQIVNRLLEAFSHIKVVLTATEYSNWFALRNHKDAQPEIRELAVQMLNALAASSPNPLNPGEWHVPYYANGVWKPSDATATRERALAISSSCCAQVSYRRLDDSVKKADDIYTRLVNADPPHLSPFEHQATPMARPISITDRGVTHVDAAGEFWSANFNGWIQHRQIMDI